MRFTGQLVQTYFNIAYNQVYDFTTARLSLYRKLQERCIGKLELRDDDQVQCVGLGTGKEVFHILQRNRNVNIVGVDYSKTALRKARKKALRLGKEINLLLMDARNLEFAAGSFDQVLCLHVMDFIQENGEATSEILRVLKQGGQFMITYPSDKEGAKLAANLLKDSFRDNVSSGNYIKGLLVFLAQVLMAVVYLPLVLRQKRFYSRRDLEATITELTNGGFQIEEDPVYQDFIVYGRK